MHGGLRTGLVALGGAAWIISAFAHWTTSGNGSTMTGLRLSSWLRSSPFRPSWGPWGAVAILVVAFAGCAAVASCTLASSTVRIAQATVAALVLAVLLALVVLDRFPLRRWDTAPWLVASGAAALLAASPAPHPSPRRPTRRGGPS